MKDIDEMKITEYFVLAKQFMKSHQNLTKTELDFIMKVIDVAKKLKNN